MLEIIQAPMARNPCYVAAKRCKPVGILVHSTGAVNSYLRRYVDAPARLGENKNGNTWNRPDAKTCVHAFIGRDKAGKVIVAQTLPYCVACWGCGKGARGSYNYDPTAHVQFEICEGNSADKAYFEEAMRVAVAYCAHLCRLMGLGADTIVSHKEAHARGYASNHGDPESYMLRMGLPGGMARFRALVREKLADTEGNDMDETTNALYQATINCRYDEGIGLWDTSAKVRRVVQVPKGKTVDVLSAPDSKGFCLCRYQGKQGWADGQYLLRVQAAPVLTGVLDNLYAARTAQITARTALDAAIRAAGGE